MNVINEKLVEMEYPSHFERYVSLVPSSGDVLTVLQEQADATLELLRTLPESKGGFRYAPGKWSVRELVGHVIDTERVLAYRALCFARGDKTPLPGFAEADYVNHASFDERTLDDLAAEFALVRAATLSLFDHLDSAAWVRTGIASGNEVSVRALAHIIAGHELHHRGILRERYLQPD